MDTIDRRRSASYGRCVHHVRLRLAGIALAAALLAVAGAADVWASNAIRPAPGAPDPGAMVLTSADLGRARVTTQRYFKDADFPSLISYEREFEDGTFAATPLLWVDSQAEVGTNTLTTARFLARQKRLFGTKQDRKSVV